MSLLQVQDLVVEFPSRRGTLRALDHVSFEIAPGEILGIAGLMGSGRTDCRSMSKTRFPGALLGP